MDNEDYSPGDQFDAQPWWISALEHVAINKHALMIE
jgi:hypothetical protein